MAILCLCLFDSVFGRKGEILSHLRGVAAGRRSVPGTYLGRRDGYKGKRRVSPVWTDGIRESMVHDPGKRNQSRHDTDHISSYWYDGCPHHVLGRSDTLFGKAPSRSYSDMNALKRRRRKQWFCVALSLTVPSRSLTH
ncbi:hypothetical protein N658DRAFT_153945 [Parathielavia hyrcaniae]|uniref:Uncharacterized protein n=1 Tax=Parathielavia hyrcaniae TaxID=113614 RepID=A0AAN6Q2I3_9PEZI|nr:hypothetical protein N658DRAFT_153945 [Parathielavia hyrcaniae]